MDVASATLTPSGGFFNDRRFAFVDADGKRISGKREAAVHFAAATFDTQLATIALVDRRAGDPGVFAIDDGRAIAAWMSALLGRPVTIARCDDGGFPDDDAAPGPTVISTATIATVATWFPDVSIDSMRRRLRTNIEIDGVPPFWEDVLYGEAGTIVPFRIGNIALDGTNPCQRCVVPSRDPDTAGVSPAFSRTLAEHREATLPVWATRSRFNHFYRLAVNTRSGADQAGASLRVGDPISLSG